MSAASMAIGIEVVRLPDERGQGLIEPLACGCSSCCCCCLHSAGSLLGAARESGIAAAGEPATEKAPKPGPPPRKSGPDGRPGTPLDKPTLEVLSAFVVFQAASRALDQGLLPVAEFDRISGALREAAQRVWDHLYPGRRGEASAWILDRLGIAVEEGIVPVEAVEHFRRHLSGQAAVRRGGMPAAGALAQLWRLHLFYMEVGAGVEAGVLARETLDRLRGPLFQQALRAARQLDVYRGIGSDGWFRGDVTEAASRRLVEMERRGVLAPPHRTLLTEILAGRRVVPVHDTSATCPICGDGLAAYPLVHCAACETPHHGQCWDYNRRCATFACGSLDKIEDGRGRDKAIRYDLSQGSERDRESSPAARAVALYWAWVVAAGVVVALVWHPVHLLFGLPVLQLAVSLLVGLMLALMGGPGREAAFEKLARMTWGAIVGTVLGILMMFFLPFLMVL